MKRKFRVSIWAALLLAGNALCGVALAANADQPSYYDPQVGELHADFVLPRIDNREAVSLSQFRGKKVLLIQFASW